MTARGKAFEYDLDQYHQILRAQKRADIRKVPTPVTILERKDRHIEGRLEPKLWCDYVGVAGPGRAVIAEAKSTKEWRFSVRSRLKTHQLDQLLLWGQLGALACLLLRCEFPGPCYGGTFVVPASLCSPPTKIAWDWESLQAAGWRVPNGRGWLDHALTLRL